MGSKIARLKKELELHCLEGSMAVKKLCRLIEDAANTEDPVRFGQHEHGSYGILIHFLEENSGAVDSIISFLEENYDEEEPEEPELSLVQALLEEEERFLCRPYFLDNIQCLGVESKAFKEGNLTGAVVAFLARRTTEENREEIAQALERMAIKNDGVVYFPNIEYVKVQE